MDYDFLNKAKILIWEIDDMIGKLPLFINRGLELGSYFVEWVNLFPAVTTYLACSV